MSTVTYIGDEPREVSMLPSGTTRLVKPDQKFTVPDVYAISYAIQPHFFEVDDLPWPPADTDPPSVGDVGDLDDDDPDTLPGPDTDPEPVIDDTPKGN